MVRVRLVPSLNKAISALRMPGLVYARAATSVYLEDQGPATAWRTGAVAQPTRLVTPAPQYEPPDVESEYRHSDAPIIHHDVTAT